MSYQKVDNSLLDDIRQLIPYVEFEQIKDAPKEWLEVIYGDLVLWGEDFLVIKDFLERAIISYQNRVPSFQEIISADYSDSFGDYFYDMANRLTARDLLNDNYPVKDFLGKHNITHVATISHLDLVVKALQYRKFISNHSGSFFSQADYDLITGRLRTGWGSIHPDDKDLELPYG